MLDLVNATPEEVLEQLDETGQLFPEFKLHKSGISVSLLGKGGFSSVYEMYHKERVEKRYALKVIGFEKHSVTSEQFWQTIRLQCFLSEQSPYVVRILDSKEVQHLQCILMEKLEDVIQKDKFKRASLFRKTLHAEAEVLNFALQIGQVLQLAHSNNILHRDIKLENIFWDEKEQCYKLGDFGIAKYVESGNAETRVYTDGYGAPEVEQCLNETYDARADIYSFGVTLYLLLNGLRFPGSSGYFVNMIQYDPRFVFPAPENASEAMTRVIHKMCSYRKEDRYQSMAEVLMDLRRIAESTGEQEEVDCNNMEDLLTETYREEKTETPEIPDGKPTVGRLAKKVEIRKLDTVYHKKSVWYSFVFMMLFTLGIAGTQQDTAFVQDWHFWLLPIAVLVEAILIYIREFHLVFGIGIALFAGYSIYVVGITVPHVVLLLCLVVSVPAVMVSGALATGLWMVLVLVEDAPDCSWIWEWDLGWLILVLLSVAWNRFMYLRMELGKTTNKRFGISLFIYDKLFIVMILVGILLWILQQFCVFVVPDIITRMHLIRTGIVSFLIMMFLYWWDGYFFDDYAIQDNEEGAIGDGESVDEG